jgi:hypothetical protein
MYQKIACLLLLPFVASCAAVAIAGAGLGVSYTLRNVAYKTFDSSLDQVNQATTLALKKLDIRIVDNSKTEKGRKVKGGTKELEILIDLERVTSKATKVKVNAKKGIVQKDKATAAEILHQIDRILEGKA